MAVGSKATADHRQMLRRLALNDDRFMELALASNGSNVDASGLDPKTHALAGLDALLALDGLLVLHVGASSLQSKVDAALAAGATREEIVGVLIAIAPIIGSARAVASAPVLALALNYEVEVALEQPDEEWGSLGARNGEIDEIEGAPRLRAGAMPGSQRVS